MTTTFSLDAKDPFTATGPGQRHAVYAALAAAGPVHRISLPTGEPAWLITGHDETRQALHDPRLIKSEQTLANIGHTEFHDWSSIMVTGVLAGPEVFIAASTAMVNFLRELIEIKRRDPADDLLSALVTIRNRADQLSEDELTSMAFLLLVAGHETTVNLIGNGVLALLTHPQQLALLQTQPERLGAAIEELLRFDGPLQVATLRLTTDSIDIGGITIPAGELVIPGLLAANRDPACIPQPDALDITRTDTSHLAFGHGIHHCLGAPLARLEGRIALGSLLARFPRLRLAAAREELTWRPGVLMHSLTTLPVALE